MAPIGVPDLCVFTPEQIKLLTADFSRENLVGNSAMCKLYRGCIPKGLNGMQEKEVTVKVWEGCHGTTPQEKQLWLASELHLLRDPRVEHYKNLLDLVGYCDTAEPVALVYGLSPLGMLHDLITRDDFDWLKRVKVALELARFLDSLHDLEGSGQLQLQDIDPAHILIDKDFRPLILHLGLLSGGADDLSASCHHQLPSDSSAAHASVPCPRLGGWSVYSFGTVLLNLIAVCKQNSTRPAIVERAKRKYIPEPLLYGEDASCSLVHYSLEQNPLYDAMDGSKVTNLAMRCVEKNPEKRPGFKEIVQFLQALRIFQICPHGRDTSLGSMARIFTPEQLKQMTNNYMEENLIGNSQFGKLYRGKFVSDLEDVEAQIVTVKIWTDPPVVWRLHPHEKRLSLANEVYFLQQPGMKGHPNLGKLVGYCATSDVLAVVYSLDPRDTLENVLMKDGLTWWQRVIVALQLARLLDFLHDREAPYIIRNIDTAHILLDKDYNPILVELGLLTGGVLGDFTRNPHQMVFGSSGYIDPHVSMTTLWWSVKCDVYSFTLVLLSLISKRLPERRGVDTFYFQLKHEHRHRMASWFSARPCLVHPSFLTDPCYKSRDGRRITSMALKCLEYRPQSRPTMKQVCRMLEDLSIVRHAGIASDAELHPNESRFHHPRVGMLVEGV